MAGSESQAVERRQWWASLRSLVAALLVLCCAAAYAWSLTGRADAVAFLTLAGVASAPFLIVSGPGRILAGVLADLLAGSVAVVLPAIGDLLDAAAALAAAALMSGKFLRLARTLPFGVACVGLYLGLWTLPGDLGSLCGWTPGRPLGLAGTLAAVLAALAGALYLLLVAGLTRWAGGSGAAAVLQTVGYPWVLLMFLSTFFVPDRSQGSG
jgi:hypothetical protein